MKKFKEPLFYLALILSGFWVADAYLKIFILHAPQRMLWYSSAGLFFVTIGLFKKNSFILTAMFCALAINESLWMISFFSTLFFGKNIGDVAAYAFKPNYPTRQFIITLHHLFLVPSSIIGLISIRKVHAYGWVGSFMFAIGLAFLTYFFPDPKGENINCMIKETIGSCRLYFSYLYSSFKDVDRIWLIFPTILSLTLFVYLPINWILIKIFGYFDERMPVEEIS